MKEIRAIIDPALLYRVIEALHRMPHFPGTTVCDAQGQDRGHGAGGRHVSYGDTLSFTKKIKLEIYCSDAMCDELVEVIRKSARIGDTGHGLIVVADLQRVIRIRSGQEQDAAV